jgi:gluconolactonase
MPHRFLAAWAVGGFCLVAAAGGAGPIDFHTLKPPADFVPKETVAVSDAVVCFLEGPAFDGKDLYFSDVAGNRIMKLDAKGNVSVFRADSGRTNSNVIDAQGRLVYVVDSHPKMGGNRKIWGFAIADDGSLSKRRLIFDFGKGRGGDGLRVDVQGNLWVAAGISVPRGPGETLDVPPGIYTISPIGEMLGRVAIPENLITNLCFAGADRKTVHVTAGKTIYRFPTNVAGYVPGR